MKYFLNLLKNINFWRMEESAIECTTQPEIIQMNENTNVITSGVGITTINCESNTATRHNECCCSECCSTTCNNCYMCWCECCCCKRCCNGLYDCCGKIFNCCCDEEGCIYNCFCNCCCCKNCCKGIWYFFIGLFKCLKCLFCGLCECLCSGDCDDMEVNF